MKTKLTKNLFSKALLLCVTSLLVGIDSNLQARTVQAQATDREQLVQQIRNDFNRWATRGEFERTADHEERLRNQSVASFYAITFDRLTGVAERFRRTNVQLGTYNADREYFPINLGDNLRGRFPAPIENAQTISRQRVSWISPNLADWRFNNNGNLEPGKIFVTVGTYRNIEVAFPAQNSRPIKIAFRDLGIENIHARNAVFDQQKIEVANRYGQSFRNTTAFFEAFLSENFSERLILSLGCSGTTNMDISSGEVGFHTDRTWIFGNQEWSDAVIATACQKATFSGGSSGNFNADCRSNPDFPGDLFSWCAVLKFQETLCPYPWRVPTVSDFIALDHALGGTGESRASVFEISNQYERNWGGARGGVCSSDGSLHRQRQWGAYWTQPKRYADAGYFLFFDWDGNFNPQGLVNKGNGLAVRCVRDVP